MSQRTHSLGPLTALLAFVLIVLLVAALFPASHAQDSSNSGADAADNAGIVFLDPLDDSPLAIPLPEGAELTPAVTEFHQTGVDPYDGDATAAAAGKVLYAKWCQACHLPDGSGRIGPSLIDDQHNHARTGTDQGMFEMLWAGGLGAMQSFATRLTQDEMLQVIAHINELKAAAD